MKALLISDTHGAIDRRIVEMAVKCDVVVHAGDIGCRRVLQQFTSHGIRALAVKGNNDTPDKWPASDRNMVRRLPGQLTLELPGGALVILHGDRIRPPAERHERLRELFPRARAVVYGHTHKAVCDQDRLPWVLNPGAAGRVRTFGGPSCIVLSGGAHGWRVRLVQFSGIFIPSYL